MHESNAGLHQLCMSTAHCSAQPSVGKRRNSRGSVDSPAHRRRPPAILRPFSRQPEGAALPVVQLPAGIAVTEFPGVHGVVRPDDGGARTRL